MSTYFDQGISYANIHVFTEAWNVNAFATSVDGRQLTCADDPQPRCQNNRKKREGCFFFSLSLCRDFVKEQPLFPLGPCVSPASLERTSL